MLDALSESLVIRSLGWVLLQFIWQGCVVALLIAAMLGLLHRHTAATRYLVATAGLLVMFLLPVATAVGHVRLGSTTASGVAAMAPSYFTTVVSQTSDTWAFSAVLVWFMGMAALSLRLVTAWYLAGRLCRRGTRPISSQWRGRVRTLASRLRVTRPVRVLESRLVRVPAVIGWCRPVLLLPVSALAGLSTVQLEAIIAHELAHIRRHDYLINGLQAAIETALFYHPAVWWLSGRIREEREHCCDDVAVAACGDAVAYGRALADLDELRQTEGTLVIAANGGSLTRRIQRLVSAPVPPSRGGLAALVFCGLAIAVACSSVDGPSELAPEQSGGTLTGTVAPSEPDPEPLRVGGEIPAPTKVHNVPPTYPPDAQAGKVTGVVVLEVLVGIDGRTRVLQVLRSVPLLDESAITAVEQWEYAPTVVDGVTVPVVMTVTVNYTLS